MLRHHGLGNRQEPAELWSQCHCVEPYNRKGIKKLKHAQLSFHILLLFKTLITLAVVPKCTHFFESYFEVIVLG